MRLVADEGVDGPIVRGLRSAGHEVTYVAELAPGLADEAVLALAYERGAVLVSDHDGPICDRLLDVRDCETSNSEDEVSATEAAP